MKAKIYLRKLLWILICGILIAGAVYYTEPTEAVVTSNASTTTSATVAVYIAIQMSPTLQSGIVFSNLQQGTTDNNADGNNYGSAGTDYWINVSSDTNVNVDYCIKADGDLTSGSNTIPLSNYYFANNTTTDANIPSLSYKTAFTTTYQKMDTNLDNTQNEYLRFWLDVPSGQTPGTYTNTVYFQAIETGYDCID